MKTPLLRLSFAAALAALALPARAASGDLLAHLSFDDAGNGGANLLRASAGADAVVRATPTNAVEGIGGIAAVTDPSILSGLPEGDGAVSIPLGQHLAVPVPAALTDVPGHPYTVVMKIRTPSGAAWRTLVNMPASNDTDALAYIHKDSRKVCLKQHSKAGGSALASTAAVPSDAWTTVALVFGENTTEVFLDGTRALSGIGPLAGSYADCSLAGGSILFCADDSGEDGPIYVSDIRVYDDVPAELVLPIGSAAEWDAFAASVTAGTLHTNRIVRLVSDVPNAAEVAAGTTAVTTMVATKKYFRGTFDGRGHTLTVALDTTSNRTAPFVRIYGATIANLTVAGTVNSTMNPASGLVGYCDDATNAIVGCTVSAAVTAPYNVGGFVGHGGNGSLAIRDCVFSGTLSGFGQYAESSNKYAGGFLGSCGSLDLTVDNCLFKGAFSPSGSGLYHPIACRGTGTGTATVSGAYYLHTAAPTATGDAVMPGADGTPVSAEVVAYRFTVPVAAADGNTYYTRYAATGEPDKPFLIASVQDWNAFAADVNAGRNDDKCYRMVADVGTAQNPASAIVGTEDHPFTGVFDGGGHTLTVAISDTTANGTAPFRKIDGATIRNLSVAGTVSGADHSAGLVGLCGNSAPNIVSNCTVSVAISTPSYAGGVVGHGGSGFLALSGCVFSGTVSGFNGFVGGLLGWCDNLTLSLADCISSGSFSGVLGGKFNPIACKHWNSTVSATAVDVYYANAMPMTVVESLIAGAEGEYVLSAATGSWNLPVTAADGRVYYRFNPDIRIATTADWDAFAAGLNDGSVSCEGKTVGLLADIGPVSSTAGTADHPFRGTFDGAGHTIDVQLCDTENAGTALFRHIADATILNLRVSGVVTGGLHCAGLAGIAQGGTTNRIMQCESAVALNCRGNNNTHCGGILGNATSSDTMIRNCLFSGSLVNASYSTGYIYGWGEAGGVHVIENCLFAGWVSSSGPDQMNTGGGIKVIDNCYCCNQSGTCFCTQATHANSWALAKLLSSIGSGWEKRYVITLSSVTSRITPKTNLHENHLELATVSGISRVYVHTGSPIDIHFAVSAFGGAILTNGVDYTAKILCDGAESVVQGIGDYKLVVEGIGDYCGTLTYAFSVVEAIPPDTPDGLFVDEDYVYPEVGYFRVNVPYSSTETVSLPDGFDVPFKVYDCGGKTMVYSLEQNGTLVVNAPDGYLLQLGGVVMTDGARYQYDYLDVYDNAAGGALVVDHAHSASYNVATALPVCMSRSFSLHFWAGPDYQGQGLDLVITPVGTNVENAVSVGNPASGGFVTADKELAKAGETVTLTAVPDSGYVLAGICATLDNGTDVVPVKWDVWSNTASFVMPGGPVSIASTFTNDLSSLSVNMPERGRKGVVIPQSVASFKVYDDGGRDGDHSYHCNGILTLIAPTGRKIQLSGRIMARYCLTVFDGGMAEGDKLIDAATTTTGIGTATDIHSVISGGRCMTLQFSGDGNGIYQGLDLTVRLFNEDEEFGIVIDDSSPGGTLESHAASAKAGETVGLTAVPENGSVLVGIRVTADDSGEVIEVTGGNWYDPGATFTMPVGAVTIVPTFTNDLTFAAGHSVNMPSTGSKSIDVPPGLVSFKVYDDGGPASVTVGSCYSKHCDGSLVLTAPEGYVLQLSGSVQTKRLNDWLSVYDGVDTNGVKLVDRASSVSDGKDTDIPVVVSGGRSMTLHFHSTIYEGYEGLDLTVSVVRPGEAFGITVNNPPTGGVVTNGASLELAGRTVVLTAIPDSGYVLDGINVTLDGIGDFVAVDWDVWANTATFTMPAGAVTVSPRFIGDLTADGGLSINMPVAGAETISVPLGVKSFKIYDDGGPDDLYSWWSDGILELVAPEGHIFQLSGTITTEVRIDEESTDYLTVYDGTAPGGVKLLDRIHSPTMGVETNIPAIFGSGRRMTIQFHSNGGKEYDGLNLTVKVFRNLTLADQGDNSDIIAEADGEQRTAILSGRFFYKDGEWNPLCLPFGMDAAQIADSPLAGAVIKELDDGTSGLSGDTLTLNFRDAAAIEAGKPYLVKWNLTNLTVKPLSLYNPEDVNVSAIRFIDEIPTIVRIPGWHTDGDTELVDGDTGTTAVTDGRQNPLDVNFKFQGEIVPDGYALWTGAEGDGRRNPASWNILARGIDDYSPWTTLADVDNSAGDMLPMANGKCAVFPIHDGGAYHEFGFDAMKDGMLELAELKFFTESPEKTTLYTICSSADWSVFAYNVDSGAWSYKDVTVKLAADIRILRPVGTSDHPFKGTFDGCGHTLTLQINSTNTPGAAAFRYISGATIENVRTEGTVKGGMHCSGLVGFAAGRGNVIRNCEVAANVVCCGIPHTHCGGILGHGTTSWTTISDCLFSGSIAGSTQATGIIYGWGDDGGSHRIERCLAAGTYADCGGLLLLGTYNGSRSIRDCYRRTSGGDQGSDASGMTDAELLAALGDEWEENGGKVAPKMETVVVPPVLSPVFEDVTASAASSPVEAGGVDFVGNTSPVRFSRHNRAALFVGADGTLASSPGSVLGSCRAYFRLDGIAEGGETLHYAMNFGDGTVTGDIGIPPASDYEIWAAANGLGEWNEKGADGIYNVFRFAFDKPSGAITDPPLLDIEIEDGGAVVKTPPLVNAEGFAVSVVESGDVAGAKVTRRKPLDATGRTEFPMRSALPRFYRLSATEGDAILGGVQLWENGPYWAECNVGALAPEESGYYFWWGDTVGYARSGGTWVSSMGEQTSGSPFSSSSCPTYGKADSELLSAGYVDSTGSLAPEHDAATVHLDAPWRIPTDAEFSALIEKCTTTWITTNGVSGRLVTGKGAYADRSIFLPVAGYGRDSDLRDPDEFGLYWSSTPNSKDSHYAQDFYFHSVGSMLESSLRYIGEPVRPVRDAD